MRSSARALIALSSVAVLVTTGSASALDGPPPPPPPGTPLSCSPNGSTRVLQGVVRQSDPTHHGHLAPRAPTDPFPACGTPNAVPAVTDAGNRYHYKTHTFMNRAGVASCVTVQLYYFQCENGPTSHTEACPPEITCEGDVASGSCGGVGPHEVAVHTGAFDPTDITKDLVAYSGRMEAGPGQDHIEVTIPAKTEFTIVVRGPELGSTVGTGLGYDPFYDLYVTGCNAPPDPPPTSSSGGAPASTSSSGGDGTPTSGAGAPAPSTPGATEPPASPPSGTSDTRDASGPSSTASADDASSASGCNVARRGSTMFAAVGLVLAALGAFARRRRSAPRAR